MGWLYWIMINVLSAKKKPELWRYTRDSSGGAIYRLGRRVRRLPDQARADMDASVKSY